MSDSADPDRPAISVILPCYNDPDHVGMAILSLQRQTFADFEALVIDDGSDDDTADRVEAAIAEDARFRLLRQPHAGLSAARNHGLEVAQAPFIAFLDADDQVAPGFLHDHFHEITATGADWTACAVTLVWPDGREVPHSAIHGMPDAHGAPRWLALEDACAVARLFPSAWNKLYRRSFIGDLRFPEGALYEDHPFFWQLACRSKRLRYLPQPLYRYRQGRAGQITARADSAILQQLARIDDVVAIVRPSAMTGQQLGLSRLATRVIHERLQQPPAPALRDVFLAQARATLQRNRLGWTRGGAVDIDPAPAPVLDPEFRMTVLVSGPDGSAREATCAALAAQHLPVACDLAAPSDGPLQALRAQLNDRSATWIAFMLAGDLPRPDWALACIELAREHGLQHIQPCAAIVSAAVQDSIPDIGRATPEGPYVPRPAMLILRRSALASWLEEQPEAATALAGLPETLVWACLAAHLAAKQGGLCYQPVPLIALSRRPVAPLNETARRIAELPHSLYPLAAPERSALFAHLSQMDMAQASTRPARLARAIAAGLARRRAGLPAPPAADHLGPYLRLLLGCR